VGGRIRFDSVSPSINQLVRLKYRVEVGLTSRESSRYPVIPSSIERRYRSRP
jgi:hypothetical protein